jgi:hypothetical protein
MQFGTRAAETPDTVSGDYLRNLKDGDTKVRFLQEVDDWIGYWEHYKGKQGFPCTGDRLACPGCVDDDERVRKANRKWGTNVLLVDRGVVLPMKLTNSIKKKMETRSARNDGTILTRDYTLMKTGSGLETEYDVEQDEKYQIDVSAHAESISDIQAILVSMYEEVWGEGSAAEALAPAKEEKRPTRRKQTTVDDQIARYKEDQKATEDVEVTEEDLRKMTLVELTKVAEKAGIDISAAESKAEALDLILAAAVEEDKPPY